MIDEARIIIDPFAPLEEILDRANRLARGEDIAEGLPKPEAGTIPAWWGNRTAEQVAEEWLRMWDRMREKKPHQEWFYLSNAIGWSSRR